MTSETEKRFSGLREVCRLAGKDANLPSELAASWTGDHWECSWVQDLDPATMGEIAVCLPALLDPGGDVAIITRLTRQSGKNWSSRRSFAPLPPVDDGKLGDRWREYLAKALAQSWQTVMAAWEKGQAQPAGDAVEALRSVARRRKTG